jgi:zinc transporter ZupT
LLWIFELVVGHNHDHSHHHHERNNEFKFNNESNSAFNSFELKPKNEREITIVSVKTNKENIINYLKAIQTNGWIAFFGDILHKTADGFAIGACMNSNKLNHSYFSTLLCFL